jgi:hypothetical protein
MRNRTRIIATAFWWSIPGMLYGTVAVAALYSNWEAFVNFLTSRTPAEYGITYGVIGVGVLLLIAKVQGWLQTLGRLLIAAGIAFGLLMIYMLWEVPDIIHRPIAFLTLYGIAVNIFKFCVIIIGVLFLIFWVQRTLHLAQEED